jgi:hypothetical protein
MKIDKNVPLPMRKSSGETPNRYGWSEMKAGDSMFFDDQPKKSQSNPSMAARVWARTNNAEFASRAEGNGVRIWRVA